MDKNAPTLEEKLEQTSLVEEKPKILFTSVASLHQMLSQSIVSLDSEMFERCLMVRDQKLIRQTVQRLSSPLVVDFLNQILVRLSEKPKRATHLIEWIRASLMFHSSYLMSLPELSSTLASLYRHLEQRVGFYEKLMKVSGKLDMILCQSNAREEQESQEAMQTYDEEQDESDNDSMDESEGSLMSTEDTEPQESEEEEEAGDSE
jgi:U3 small nucleolar RNA-associated protein 5